LEDVTVKLKINDVLVEYETGDIKFLKIGVL